MLVLLIFVKIVFGAAFPNILSIWNAPLGKVPRIRTVWETMFVISLPWRFALSIRISKTLKSQSYVIFFHMKLFLQLQSISPQWKLFCFCCLHFYINVPYYSPTLFPLQGSPSVDRGYEVAVTAIRPHPGPQNTPVCSFEASRWLVFSAVF